jgi:hypothetical protein
MDPATAQKMQYVPGPRVGGSKLGAGDACKPCVLPLFVIENPVGVYELMVQRINSVIQFLDSAAIEIDPA